MPPLPLNCGIDQFLRRGITAALFAAPMALALLALLPLILLENSAMRDAGLPLSSDISIHPNGAILEPLFILAAAIFLVIGYLLAWAVNALALWAIARWPMEKVRRTFLHSEVPSSWERVPKFTSEQRAAMQEEFSRWQLERRQGLRMYILKFGALKMGLCFFAILTIAPLVRHDPKLESHSLGYKLLSGLVIGMALAAILWYWQEHRYLYRERLMKSPDESA